MTWQCTWLLVVSIHRVKGPFAELGIRYFHEDWLQQLACQWNEQLTNIYLTQHKNYRECRGYNTMGKTTWSPWSYIFLITDQSSNINSFHAFFAGCWFFQNQLFQKILSGIPSQCQTLWIQIRPDVLSGLIWVQIDPKCYQQTIQVGKELTLCMLGNVSCLCCCLLT